ncbi:hypothetical protein LX32DRAFT_639153 [Colletotrichum zoysiae]|uniref:Uncharacterized protein n=1 Tax=Colletotrichum zoysiae TaxID=1216348 RepID=A0AAD9M282_9PEZI|nr:hypothetical protein LX32DRAFT_639153 [Colletotrichum zoysiae]
MGGGGQLVSSFCFLFSSCYIAGLHLPGMINMQAHAPLVPVGRLIDVKMTGRARYAHCAHAP